MSIARYRNIIEKAELFEITRPETRREADRILLDAGWYRLGKGSFAAVYGKPELNYALKVFNAKDQAYLDYIEFVAANPGNPHLPKFHKKIVKVTDNILAIRMELLEPLKPKHILLIHDLDYFLFLYEANNIPRFAVEYTDKVNLFKEAGLGKLIETLEKIHDRFHAKYKIDVNIHSFMVRNDTIVIVDPLSVGHSLGDEKFDWVPHQDRESFDREVKNKKGAGPKWTDADEELLKALQTD